MTKMVSRLLLIISTLFCDSVNSFIIPTNTLGTKSNQNQYRHQLQSSTDEAITKSEKKAGEEGYSILRQPLNWDTESDPRFEAPKSLDESKETYKARDADWFQSRALGPQFNTKENDSTSSEQHWDKHGQNQRTDEFNQELNLFERTLDTLDYPMVLNALSRECNTAPAKQIVLNAIDQYKNEKKDAKNKKRKSKVHGDDDILSMALTAQNVQECHDRYAAIKEMNAILSFQIPIKKMKKMGKPPLSTCDFYIAPMLEKIDAGGVLDGPDILEVGAILDACMKVSGWCTNLDEIERQRKKEQTEFTSEILSDDDKYIQFKQLPKLGYSIFIEDDLISLLENAFDDEGRLSGSRFPTIGRLRAKVRTLKADIIGTLDALMSSPSIKKKVSLESGGSLYSEVNGRIVIPISDTYKNSVGIIHDQSRSGKTSYVEPTEVVGPTNEMRSAEMELKQEEMKIWRQLTKEIKDNIDDIERSIAAVAQLDLVLARIRLGDLLEGVVPEVGDEGVMSLQDARHPVLLLRGLENVVGSDIDIGGGKNQGLVLTGPNSGGKTVILKLIGLCALMARDGIPIPAKPDSARIDFFSPVLADIGDMQSVDGDLSTFSGHMLVCREVLAKSGKNSLVLMDELGSGTDPNQGVAIAQALLEALMNTGARVAITTHYLELKQLAASDNRFNVGGMQFKNGRPTYKLLPGVVGESFALSVAERLNLPRTVIERANELLDSETRQMGDLIRGMEDQKAIIDHQTEELSRKRNELGDLEKEMKKQQQKLEMELINARRNEAEKFAKKLEEKESILESILEKLKSDPSKKLVARSWDEIKYVRRDALTEAENVPSVLRRKEKAAAAVAQQFTEIVPLSELRNLPEISPGDTLVVCKKGALRGAEATLINISGKRVDVTVRGMPMMMKLGEVALPPKSFQPSEAIGVRNTIGADIKNSKSGPQMSKMARKALADEESDVVLKRNNNSNSQESTKSNGPVMRLSSNTVDCLGCSFEEARRKCEDKFSRVMMSKNPVVFILHGHGTKGVLKQKIREWLKRDKQWVKSFGTADASDGGDAFTIVKLKNLQL